MRAQNVLSYRLIEVPCGLQGIPWTSILPQGRPAGPWTPLLAPLQSLMVNMRVKCKFMERKETGTAIE